MGNARSHHSDSQQVSFSASGISNNRRRRSRRLSALNTDNFSSLDQVTSALRESGLESSNMIIGIDFTKSNEWTGHSSFGRKSLHTIGEIPNPYEQAISIIGRTLSPFECNSIPCFGFGDASTYDRYVFSFFADHRPCHGFEEVLSRYREIIPRLRLAGPTSFAPLIHAARDIVEKSDGQYHVLVIFADGQVTEHPSARQGSLSKQVHATMQAIVEASYYPLSIIMVGVGDGPWDSMLQCDGGIPQRAFENFQFVNFTEVMSANMELSKKEVAFALAALMEIPFQYRATRILRPFQIRERITDGLSVLPPPREVIEWDNLAAISHPPAASSKTSGSSAPIEQLNQGLEFGLRELELYSHNECNEENRGQSHRTTSEEKQAEGGDGSQNLNFRDEWSSLKVFYSEIENATNGLCESSKIGKGGFGFVYKGKLGGTMVAIKILDSSSKQGAKEFFQELEVLYEMQHPNLVKLVGACFEIRALVYEYLPNGSLEDCLKENPSLLTWQMRTRIIYEICLALIYLHSRSVVHSDLKPANILLDANFKSKLSDFGLCRFLPKDMTTAVFLETVPKGTSGYIDPWFFETCILRPGSDLYSFGVTILKLLTRMPAVGLGRKACDADENSFREMIDPTAGSWPFEMAKELLYWSLQCCYHNEKSWELLKDMLTCLEDMLTEIETEGEGKFKRVVKEKKAAGEGGE